MSNELHDKVLAFAEGFRKLHPEFTYALRKANRKGRLDEGTWFQGREDYAFLGLVNRSGGTNMTKSIGLVFAHQGEDVKCLLEIVSNEETDSKILKLYKEIRTAIDGFEMVHQNKYQKIISQDNGFKAAQDFLINTWPRVISIIEKHKLQDLLVSKIDLEKGLERIKEIKSQIANGPNYWLFQGNPKVFDFEAAIKANAIHSWTVSAHRDKIKDGDKVILWITGPYSGCYALAEIISEPYERQEATDDSFYKTEDKSEWQVGIRITHNLIDKPILQNAVKGIDSLKYLKAGNQGTNFSSSKTEFETLLNMAKETDKDGKKYWLYAPGQNANFWDEVYDQGIMALGWDRLGDLNQYKDKEQITKRLQMLEATDSSKKNDATANYEFKNVLSIGDIIICKKGRTELLGYGIVASEYFYDETRKNLKSCRKVEWKKRGNWKLSYSLPLKTLTDVTDYPSEHPDFEKYFEELMNEMGGDIDPIIQKSSHSSLNLILFGPPGTGKTYSTIEHAIKIADPGFFEENGANRKKLTSRFRELLFDPATEKGQIAFVTFHQSMSYEDFIEGIKPITPDADTGQIAYEITPGIFKRLVKAASAQGGNFVEKIEWLKNECSEADNKPPLKINTGSSEFTVSYRGGKTFRIKPKESVNKQTDYPASIDNIRRIHEGASRSEVYNPTYVVGILQYLYSNGLTKENSKRRDASQSYVLIIDEINRGNISQIFGELITLLEPDKRLDAKESLEIILPYSKEKFGVPSNLYIIGTMNTADRSVEALDAALRRRFTFEEMPPRYDLPELDTIVVGYPLKEILYKINVRLEKLLDKDHKIGHSYFMFPGTNNPVSSLIDSFYKNIIPLLQEYFFGDYGKIGLVLGKGFVKQADNQDKIFCDFNYDGTEMLLEKPIYTILDYRNSAPDIEPGMTFENAIETLIQNRI